MPRGQQMDHSAVWTVPYQGTLRSLPPHRLPKDAVYDASNILIREGHLAPRPGLVQHDPTDLGARVLGAFNATSLAAGAFQEDAFQNDAFQIGQNTPSISLLAATTRKIWAYFGGVWNDITGVALGARESDIARFTSIEIGGTIFNLHTNGLDNPRQWDGVAATTSDVAGSPPLFTDWTVIGDHVIGIIPPYAIRWGDGLSISSWPANNIRTLSDTADRLIAVRNLGTMGGAVFKSRSLWNVIPFGTTEASFFHFDLRGLFEGPANSAAVVDADGVLLYMSDVGRVAAYDGSRHRWVGDGIFPIIKADLDQSNAIRIFGVYNPFQREVYFFYPRIGDAGECRGKITVILPRPKDGIEDFICFPGRLSHLVSAGSDLRLGTRKALVFRSSDHRSYTFEEGTNDAGTEFSGHWQTGLEPMPGEDQYRVESMEVFAERGSGFGTLTVKPVSTNLISEPLGTLGPEATVDLAKKPPADLKGSDARGSFLGVRHEFTTPVTLRWYATKMAMRRVE